MHNLKEEYPQREKLPHAVPPWVSTDAIFFITICCAPRDANQLCHDHVASIIWESVKFRQQREDWYVRQLLLMPDHLHALISFPRNSDPSKVIANWKEIVAKKTGVKWQRDFFDHRLRSDESYEEKATYIRQNPVRKGLIANATDWKFIWVSDHTDGGPSGPALPLNL